MQNKFLQYQSTTLSVLYITITLQICAVEDQFISISSLSLLVEEDADHSCQDIQR